jgi:hypothetical protein
VGQSGSGHVIALLINLGYLMMLFQLHKLCTNDSDVKTSGCTTSKFVSLVSSWETNFIRIRTNYIRGYLDTQ